MDLRSLRYFIETARAGSFTEAARSLGVTQSTISKMVRQTEDELGDLLLKRDSKPLALTDTGQVVLERGLEVLEAMQRLEKEVRETQSVARGALALGMPPMINLLFTEALKTFRQKHAGVNLSLHECTGREAERLVSRGDLASAMSVMPLELEEDIQHAVVARHQICAIAAEGVFKGSSDIVTLNALSRHPLIMLTDDFALTRLLKQHLRRIDIDPELAAQSAQWDWTVAMARAGMGVALLPEPFLKHINHDGLDFKYITQPEIHWEIALMWNPRKMSHALRAWLEICQRELGGEWLEDEN